MLISNEYCTLQDSPKFDLLAPYSVRDIRPHKLDYVFLLRWSVGLGTVLRFRLGARNVLKITSTIDQSGL